MDTESVISIRRLGVETVQTLNANGFSTDEVAALMLTFALETVWKITLTFTETIAFFIDPNPNILDLDNKKA